MTTVVALYTDLATAQQAAQDLLNMGFNRDDISLAAGDAEGEYRRYLAADEPHSGEAEANGAGVGAVVGGLGGLIVGLGTLLIPGVGPIIAAGPLLTSLGVGAGVGAVTGGLAGALADMGVPEEDANYYTEGVRRGSTLLTVQVSTEQVNQAKEVMERHQPIDIDERANQWQQEGLEAFDTSLDPFYTDAYELSEDNDYNFDEYEWYNTRFQQHYQNNYTRSNYTYDNYSSAYRYGLDLANYHYYSGGRTWAEAETEAQQAWEDQNPGTWEHFKDAVRYAWEEITNSLDYNEDYNGYRPDFQQHYQQNFSGNGDAYELYDRAYHYGFGLSHDPRFSHLSWTEIEPEARRYWEEEYGNTWGQFQDAVHHGWEKIKQAVNVP